MRRRISIRDVAIAVSGFHPETSSTLRGFFPAEGPREASAVEVAFLPAAKVRYARGCPRADALPRSKDTGLVTRCAIARIRDVAVDIVEPHI